MLREMLHDALRDAQASLDERAASVIKLIFTALNERDICARQSGLGEQVSDHAIRTMIRDMIGQRQEEKARAEQTGRLERAEQEAQEIEILSGFLPKRMSEDEIGGAVEVVIRDTGATGLKDAGKVMASLKQRFGAEMDIVRAKKLVCNRLR